MSCDEHKRETQTSLTSPPVITYFNSTFPMKPFGVSASRGWPSTGALFAWPRRLVHVVGPMSSARREIDEEGTVRSQRAVAADEIDGLAMKPSGKHTKNDGKSPFQMGKSTVTNWKITIFYGKIHYFYGHFQKQTVSLPEGTRRFSLVLLTCTRCSQDLPWNGRVSHFGCPGCHLKSTRWPLSRRSKLRESSLAGDTDVEHLVDNYPNGKTWVFYIDVSWF